MPKQGIAERTVILDCRSRTRHHDEIQTLEIRAMTAENFTRQPLQSVSIDGSSHLLLGDCQTEASGCAIVAPGREDGEICVGGTGGFREYASVLRSNGQTCRLRKSPVWDCF